MIEDLQVARDRVQGLLSSADSVFMRRLALAGAVFQAEVNQQRGDMYDTRVLASVLAPALADAAERSDQDQVTLYSAKLLAVLSIIADDGEEETAIAINEATPGLDVHVIGLARAYARKLRNGEI